MWEIWDLENQYCSQYEVNYFTDMIINAERNWYIYIYTSKLVKQFREINYTLGLMEGTLKWWGNVP